MQLRFSDTDLDGQFQRSVAKSDYGMANAGECLAIASTVDEQDLDSWYPAFSGFATTLTTKADEDLARGHRVSARGKYLRAGEYFRNAFFYRRADLGDHELHAAYDAHRRCFRAALPLFDHPVTVLEVAGDGAEYGGYLATPPGAGPWPTVVMPGGYDGTAEELYPTVVEAVSRGYAAYVFDGPGQGGVLYDQHVVMRPDWETVLPPVVDALTARPEVESDRLILMGRSFGGYLAPRAASSEHRFAALVVDPGQYDLGASLADRLPKELASRIHEDTPDADAAFDALLGIDQLHRLFAPRMATHGARHVRTYIEMMLEYTTVGRAPDITCPTLVCDNETDLVSTGQGQLLYDHLSCPKTFVRFTAAEGAEGHCEGLAAVLFFARAFNWIDETLTATR